jgi:hypothetical protein
MLADLGVDLGQGYLIGKPAMSPAAPRARETLRLDAARQAIGRRVEAARPRVPGRSHRAVAAAD